MSNDPAVALGNLLGILTDPEKTKTHLASLKKASADNKQKLDELAAAQLNLDAALIKQGKEHQDLEKLREEIRVGQNELKNIAARREDLARDMKLRDEAVRAQTQRETALKERETRLAADETRVRVADAAVGKRAEDLATAEADYKERMKALKALAS